MTASAAKNTDFGKRKPVGSFSFKETPNRFASVGYEEIAFFQVFLGHQ